MSLKNEAVELLRQFADFNGAGIRGVVRMKRLQEDAKSLLEKLDRKSSSVGI